ncbi:MAG TPA: transposase [Polyangia bacterium]|nr:transposase [Polyangia bacterium]
MLVTLRARTEVDYLRRGDALAAMERALSRANKAWFRIFAWSVQTDHVHLVVEADSRLALIRGVQGLAVRCAKAVNKALGRKGAVWDHRYHARRLKTPSEVRAALVYVLLNFRKHLRAAPGIDPCSSGPWFEGWTLRPRPPPGPPPVAPARTWLAREGWLRAGGPIDPSESPSTRR